MKKKRLLTDRTGDLQEIILAEQAKNMAREIDREILWNMLSEMGWHRVVLSTFDHIERYEDVIIWTKANCKNPYERYGFDYIFEDERDANWFKLRWLA